MFNSFFNNNFFRNRFFDNFINVFYFFLNLGDLLNDLIFNRNLNYFFNYIVNINRDLNHPFYRSFNYIPDPFFNNLLNRNFHNLFNIIGLRNLNLSNYLLSLYINIRRHYSMYLISLSIIFYISFINFNDIIHISGIFNYPLYIFRNNLLHRYISFSFNMNFLFVNSFIRNLNLLDNWNFHYFLNRFFFVNISDHISLNDFLYWLFHINIIRNLDFSIYWYRFFSIDLNDFIYVSFSDMCFFCVNRDNLINPWLSKRRTNFFRWKLIMGDVGIVFVICFSVNFLFRQFFNIYHSWVLWEFIDLSVLHSLFTYERCFTISDITNSHIIFRLVGLLHVTHRIIEKVIRNLNFL